jgi:hypothetical protein
MEPQSSREPIRNTGRYSTRFDTSIELSLEVIKIVKNEIEILFRVVGIFRIIQYAAHSHHTNGQHTIYILPFIEFAFCLYIHRSILSFGTPEFFIRFAVDKLESSRLNDIVCNSANNFFRCWFCLCKCSEKTIIIVVKGFVSFLNFIKKLGSL